MSATGSPYEDVETAIWPPYNFAMAQRNWPLRDRLIPIGSMVRKGDEYFYIVGYDHPFRNTPDPNWVCLRPIGQTNGPTPRQFIPTSEVSLDTVPCAECGTLIHNDYLCRDCRFEIFG